MTTMLRNLGAYLRPEKYVFCTLPDGNYGVLPHTTPLASIMENEGLTLVLTQQNAEDAGLHYEGTFRCISLKLHSSLDAVGLTAAVSGELASHGISANMLAGYHHDHLLVPSVDAERAVHILGALGK
jgi:uncharacterized protein